MTAAVIVDLCSNATVCPSACVTTDASVGACLGAITGASSKLRTGMVMSGSLNVNKIKSRLVPVNVTADAANCEGGSMKPDTGLGGNAGADVSAAGTRHALSNKAIQEGY